MRRFGLVAALALMAGALFVASAAAGPELKVVEAKGPDFPVRSFVISLPHGSKLNLGNTKVTENGGAVVEPTLTPASQASAKTFGVVLVLDTSFSMAGKPLAAAVAAAQAFAVQRNHNAELGAIAFNRKSTIALPLTTSAGKIADALATPLKLGGGTHIYDAVHQAESMLAVAHINSGSIVVLSDGADTGSKKTIDQVARTALRSNMRIYTIGLNDAQYNPRTLKALAAAGHGEYAEASTQTLAPLFHKLGQTLSNEYLLQYKSLAKPDVPVHVQVSVSGLGSSTAAYRTPELRVAHPVTPTYKQSIGGRIWASTITMILLVLLGACAAALLALALLQPRRTGLPARMAEFVSIRELQKDAKGKPAPTTTTVAIDPAGIELPAVTKSAWTRFREMLEIADIKLAPEMIVAGTLAATVLAFLLIYVVSGSGWWALLALLVPYAVREWVVRTLARRRNRFAEQLPDALQVVASALRSGHSFAGALAVVVDSGSEPMKTELQRVVADEQRGVPMQASLGVVAERMASRDLEQLALVAELQREAGGNAAEVIDRVAETVRERFDLKRMIKTLTTQGRMSRWIVSALPIFIIIIFELENPHYLHPLFSTLGGRLIFGFAVVWGTLGSFAIKKIVEIEV